MAFDVNSITTVCREAITTAMIITMPVLLMVMAVGIAMGFLQAVTQIQEQTISMVPKMVAAGFVVMALLPWMLARLMNYTTQLFEAISRY